MSKMISVFFKGGESTRKCLENINKKRIEVDGNENDKHQEHCIVKAFSGFLGSISE